MSVLFCVWGGGDSKGSGYFRVILYSMEPKKRAVEKKVRESLIHLPALLFSIGAYIPPDRSSCIAMVRDVQAMRYGGKVQGRCKSISGISAR